MDYEMKSAAQTTLGQTSREDRVNGTEHEKEQCLSSALDQDPIQQYPSALARSKIDLTSQPPLRLG